MNSIAVCEDFTLNGGMRCYRLTSTGQACVELVETGEQAIGSLSRYLHDVLMMCGSGVWFDQLRQFMPPRSLEESLQALLSLGLIECQEAGTGSAYAQPLRWNSTRWDSARRSALCATMVTS